MRTWVLTRIPRRRAAAPPRVVLAWVVVLVLVSLAVYAIAPRILPARIVEGPLVQMPGEHGVTLVWYTSRPAECTLTLDLGDEQRQLPAESDGRRNRIELDGLLAGTAYGYRIHTGDRALTNPLTFQTDRATGPFTFLVFGDSGRGSRAQYELATQMARTQPSADFMLHTGDVVYPSGARSDYTARFFTPYAALLARIPFWPCLGNHDVQDGEAPAYQEVFEVPANGPETQPEDFNYWFDYANTRFVVVDSNADEATLRDVTAPWLREVLEAPGPQWRFVSFHHPPYTGGRYKPDARIQHTLVPVMQEAGVDIVFNGHDHNYQRSRPIEDGQVVPPGNGIVYVITGAGGAQLYAPKGPLPDYTAVFEQDFSFTQVTIDGTSLHLRQIARDGHVLDEFTLDKSAQPIPTTAPQTPGVDAATPDSQAP